MAKERIKCPKCNAELTCLLTQKIFIDEDGELIGYDDEYFVLSSCSVDKRHNIKKSVDKIRIFEVEESNDVSS